MNLRLIKEIYWRNKCKKLISIMIYGFMLVGCATTVSEISTEKQLTRKKILVSTFDLRREYKVLGAVSARKISLFLSVSTHELNSLLRQEAHRKYNAVDAIINVRYIPIIFAQGILDMELGRIGEGIAVKFPR